jgi:hypothetical protein
MLFMSTLNMSAETMEHVIHEHIQHLNERDVDFDRPGLIRSCASWGFSGAVWSKHEEGAGTAPRMPMML